MSCKTGRKIYGKNVQIKMFIYVVKKLVKYTLNTYYSTREGKYTFFLALAYYETIITDYVFIIY